MVGVGVGLQCTDPNSKETLLSSSWCCTHRNRGPALAGHLNVLLSGKILCKNVNDSSISHRYFQYQIYYYWYRAENTIVFEIMTDARGALDLAPLLLISSPSPSLSSLLHLERKFSAGRNCTPVCSSK